LKRCLTPHALCDIIIEDERVKGCILAGMYRMGYSPCSSYIYYAIDAPRGFVLLARLVLMSFQNDKRMSENQSEPSFV